MTTSPKASQRVKWSRYAVDKERSLAAVVQPRSAQVRHLIHGYAHSPHGAVSTSRVEYVDSGVTWTDARVQETQAQYSWVRFEFDWDASPGEYTHHDPRHRRVRATLNQTAVPFNEKGLPVQPAASSPHPGNVTRPFDRRIWRPSSFRQKLESKGAWELQIACKNDLFTLTLREKGTCRGLRAGQNIKPAATTRGKSPRAKGRRRWLLEWRELGWYE